MGLFALRPSSAAVRTLKLSWSSLSTLSKWLYSRRDVPSVHSRFPWAATEAADKCEAVRMREIALNDEVALKASPAIVEQPLGTAVIKCVFANHSGVDNGRDLGGRRRRSVASGAIVMERANAGLPLSPQRICASV